MQHTRQTRRVANASGRAFTLVFSLILAACGAGLDSQTTTVASAVPQTGVLAEIVVPDQHNSLLPGVNGVEISTSMSVTDLTAFFEDQMPSKGGRWPVRSSRSRTQR